MAATSAAVALRSIDASLERCRSSIEAIEAASSSSSSSRARTKLEEQYARLLSKRRQLAELTNRP